MKYMISYDLLKPGQDYQTLYDELERFNAVRILDSQWILDHNNTNAVDLRDHFRGFIDSNDRLMVVGVSGWAGRNLLSKIS